MFAAFQEKAKQSLQVGKEILLALETIGKKRPFDSRLGAHLIGLGMKDLFLGRMDEAKSCAVRAEKILSVCFGPEHPFVKKELRMLKKSIFNFSLIFTPRELKNLNAYQDGHSIVRAVDRRRMMS